MMREFLVTHWGPVVASVLIVAVTMSLLYQALGRSPGGQLRRMLTELADHRRAQNRAVVATEKAEARLDRLLQQARNVAPRQLQEAKDALNDTRALQKIADDKVMIAENHVRRIILEEFPPSRHARLRQKYLPEQATDRRPFSF